MADRPPFSNGTEGYAWEANWCHRCTKDDAETELWCPILGEALLGRTPVQWIEQDRFSLGDRYHCTDFDDRDKPDDGPDTPPKPPKWDPEMPGQIDIFEALTDLAVAEFEAQPQPERQTVDHH